MSMLMPTSTVSSATYACASPVAAGEETTAMLTFVGTFDDPDFNVNNDLNDIYLNIWMFEEQTGNVYFRDLVHIP